MWWRLGVPTSSEMDELSMEVNLYALVSHFYWAIWALVQASVSDIDFDYMSYAVRQNIISLILIGIWLIEDRFWGSGSTIAASQNFFNRQVSWWKWWNLQFHSIQSFTVLFKEMRALIKCQNDIETIMEESSPWCTYIGQKSWSHSLLKLRNSFRDRAIVSIWLLMRLQKITSA